MDEPRGWNMTVHLDEGRTETRAEFLERCGYDAFGGRDPYTRWLLEERRKARRPKPARSKPAPKATTKEQEAPAPDPKPADIEEGDQ